jgi:hypothetical protein
MLRSLAIEGVACRIAPLSALGRLLAELAPRGRGQVGDRPPAGRRLLRLLDVSLRGLHLACACQVGALLLNARFPFPIAALRTLHGERRQKAPSRRARSAAEGSWRRKTPTVVELTLVSPYPPGVARLPVKKTYKLFIGGAFPRSESGRTYEAQGQTVARASRKDVRDAVVAARSAQPKWGGATAYNRGQVLYRIAEMMEARTAEFAELASGRDEVERAIDRWVWYAGFADKLAQVLGSSNPVAGPYFNFTVTEPTGVVGIVAPDEPPLLGLVSRIAPALVGGNAVVALASETSPLAAIELAEALATSDVPDGAVNLLTGYRAELAPWLASHMDVNAIDLTGADGLRADLERAAAENVKRVVLGAPDSQSLYEIAAFLELKTVWHPIGV